MKRMISLLLAALAVVTLAACGSKSSATADAAGLADALVQKVQFDSEMNAVSADDLGFYIELPAKCEVGAYMSSGATAEEIFVIQCYDKTDAAAVKVSIQSYLDGRVGQTENKMASLAYKQAVELDMLSGIIADSFQFSEEDLRRRRAESVRNVKQTNGRISFEKRVRESWEDDDGWQG